MSTLKGSPEPHLLTKKSNFQQILSPRTGRMLIQNNNFRISFTSLLFSLLLFREVPGAGIDRNIALLYWTETLVSSFFLFIVAYFQSSESNFSHVKIQSCQKAANITVFLNCFGTFFETVLTFSKL